jgi:ATP-dependent Clp protease, protease subunit
MTRNFQAREARFSSKVLQEFTAHALPTTLQVKAATKSAPAEIMLYDEIGDYGITAKAFTAALDTIPAGDTFTLRINSPGGDVFDAMAIYNALQGRAKPVHVVVDGLAASAASLIAMAGDTLAMHETSMLMIHNSHTISLGDRHDMTETAGILEKIDGQMAAIYAKRITGEVADAHAMMDAETWLTSTEALNQGLCDKVISPPIKAEMAQKIAASLKQIISEVETPDDGDDTGNDKAMQMAAEKAVRLRQLQLITASY